MKTSLSAFLLSQPAVAVVAVVLAVVVYCPGHPVVVFCLFVCLFLCSVLP